ncbi:hypothetical protein [Candidatus Thalassolituus haligoni]|uniref:hypothetical protein n=1 Tax=Candidatus Thalassolituus haligoni TaxID=3100113 RepID=UPI0035189F5B|tara:strand:+ start:4295 stop:4516 length:222 start_codon:yes stop_codon:yes gene_type:complete
MNNPGRLRSGWEIYRWPLLVNMMALAGIFAALIGNGWWDGFSWLTLGLLSVGVSLTIGTRRLNVMARKHIGPE